MRGLTGAILAIVFLTGGAAPTPTSAQAGLFKFIRTVQVTPDDKFPTGSLGYIHYLPATDRLLVIISPELPKPVMGCAGKGAAYKEYTTDMQATGKSGVLSCAPADGTSFMVDNTFYFVRMAKEKETVGWHLYKYDPVSWKTLAELFIPLDFPKEQDGGPTIAYVNGQLDITGEYRPSGGPFPDRTSGSHHRFLTTDLKPLAKKYLTDTPHVPEGTMLYVDGIYYYLAASTADGEELIVMKYDKDWKYLGVNNRQLKQAACPWPLRRSVAET
jgi:hypothetical protein